MAAGIYDIIIEQYAIYSKAFQLLEMDGVTPEDLTGKVGKMQIRKSFDSSAVLVELSTTNGRMTLDSQGYITLYLTKTQTAVLNWIDAVYDITIDGERVIQGRAILDRGATRD